MRYSSLWKRRRHITACVWPWYVERHFPVCVLQDLSWYWPQWAPATMRELSEVMARHFILSVYRIVCVRLKFCKFHTHMVQSSDPDMSRLLSSLIAMHQTTLLWPVRVHVHFAVGMCHTRILKSCDPEAAKQPSLDTERHLIPSLWPESVWTQVPTLRFQIFKVLSAEPEISWQLLTTCKQVNAPVCPSSVCSLLKVVRSQVVIMLFLSPETRRLVLFVARTEADVDQVCKQVPSIALHTLILSGAPDTM